MCKHEKFTTSCEAVTFSLQNLHNFGIFLFTFLDRQVHLMECNVVVALQWTFRNDFLSNALILAKMKTQTLNGKGLSVKRNINFVCIKI